MRELQIKRFLIVHSSSAMTEFVESPLHKSERVLLALIDAALLDECKDNELVRDDALRKFIYRELDTTDPNFEKVKGIVENKSSK